MSILPILCVVGESGSGKTTLLERLIPKLSAGGLKVGVVKHAARDLVLADQLVNVNTSDELSALRARVEGDRVK